MTHNDLSKELDFSVKGLALKVDNSVDCLIERFERCAALRDSKKLPKGSAKHVGRKIWAIARVLASYYASAEERALMPIEEAYGADLEEAAEKFYGNGHTENNEK